MDGQPINQSRSLLLTAVGKVENKGMQWNAERTSVGRDWGTGPTRAEGIPARFIIGFPLKADAEGTVPGYHCWAEFYLPGRGWIPVDASDASKAT